MVFFYTLSMQEKALVVENLELWLRKKSRSCADTTLELFGATLMLAWWGKLYMQAFITAIPLMPTLNTSTVLKELTAGASTSEALRTVTTCMTIQRAFITRLTFNGFTGTLHQSMRDWQTSLSSPGANNTSHRTPMKASTTQCGQGVQNSKNHTLRQVNFALTTSWTEYNFGPQELSNLDTAYGMDVGAYTLLHRKRKEEKRLTKSEWVCKGNEKKRRKKVADGKQRATEEDAEATYRPGGFWFSDTTWLLTVITILSVDQSSWNSACI